MTKCQHRRRMAIERFDWRSWRLLRIEIICRACQKRLALKRRPLSPIDVAVRCGVHD